MEAKDYLDYIVNVLHTVIVATVDDEGLPVTAAIDMMDCDEGGLYFLTAKGKGFYDRLVKRGFLSLTGVQGDSTMRSAAVSVRGKVRELGFERIPELVAKNPYMGEIYPTEPAMQALTAFQLYEGSGEWFDLSKKPIERASFSFGGKAVPKEGYVITQACIGCGSCVAVCPQDCIGTSRLPYEIEQAHCLHCGNCRAACPNGAVIRR
ncbi:MAG: 4Fe-4S binding protein [Eubacterium sp.]|nr:4Fe-4S binding protein [Eubacterium sp.]